MKKYEILYRDEDLCVIHKRAGLAVQSARASVPDLMSMLRNDLLEEGMKNPYLGLVNRLDQPVEGILLVAFNEKAAADLSRQVADHIHMEKWYQALVCGKPSAKSGTLVDYLLKDARNNLSKVVPEGTRGSKRSELTYEVLESWGRSDSSEDPSAHRTPSSDPGTAFPCGHAHCGRCQIWERRRTALPLLL